jgi:hypothetical protein
MFLQLKSTIQVQMGYTLESGPLYTRNQGQCSFNSNHASLLMQKLKSAPLALHQELS